MKIEVSVGEIIDKMTILSIKENKISDEKKRKNVSEENTYLKKILDDAGLIEKFSHEIQELTKINQILWDIEDNIREKELHKQFDSEFIELARSVYVTNDKRFEVKRKINEMSNSSFKEEKSYAKYN
jgi:hypothetical protein